MFVAQYFLCIAQACMLIEPVKYVIFKEQQQCEAVAEVEAGKLLVLFKNENVKAIAYRCVDKSDDSV